MKYTRAITRLIVFIFLFVGFTDIVAKAEKNGGMTTYQNTSGHYFITLKKGNSTGIYKISCSVPSNNNAGRQIITYSISRESGTDLGVAIINGTYYTEADDYAGVDGWTANERHYILPIKLRFTNQTGYTLKYNSSESFVVYGPVSLSGDVADIKTSTNAVGMTNWAYNNDGNYYHNNMVFEWVANSYQVKYNRNSGSGSMSNSSHAYDSAQRLTANAFTRTGYTFSGWATSSTGNAVYSNKQSVTNLTSTNNDKFNLYAKWTPITYQVKYNGNGSTSGSMSNGSHTYDTAKNLTANAFQRTGYKFAGWATSENGNIVYSNSRSVTNLASTNNATVNLYAKWTPITYQVKYNGNGSTGGSISNSTHTYDTARNLTANAFQKTGYKFIGWATSSNGAVVHSDGKSVMNLTTADGGEFNLYAKWMPINYTIKYNANGGTGNMVDIRVFEYDNDKAYQDSNKDINKMLTATLLKNTLTKEFYEFIGWNTKADGSGTSYIDKQAIKNLTTKDNETVTLYAQWEKHLFNVAYSGNEQTLGMNMLENNISLGDNYIFRPNVFEKIEKEKRKTASGVEYEVEQKYSFQGWKFDVRLNNDTIITSNESTTASDFYYEAKIRNAISTSVSDSRPYEEVKPLTSTLAKDVVPLSNTVPAKEYINLSALWDAYPIIVVEPTPDIDQDEEPRIKNNTLFFYEGEKPLKEDLISHLIVMDQEDGDLFYKLKIKKIVYADGILKKGYTMEWDNDIPKDYIFDTYYLKMEEDEVLTHMVTYEVTDSVGNTTTEELPVKVKYNNPPEIHSPEEYYYYKDDVDRGILTKDEVLSIAEAFDIEDGDKIKGKLELADCDLQAFKMQTVSVAEFPVRYKVTDSFRKTTYRDIKIIVVDPAATEAERPIRYIRFISLKHINTLEPTSIWRKPENYAYLKSVLENKTPKDSWYFTHADVEEIKAWVIGEESGNWKIGRKEYVKEFWDKFARCRKSK